MYKSYIANKEEDNEDLLENISRRFSELYRTLEDIKKIDTNIDEDSILQYHFIAYEEWGKKRDYQNYLAGIKNKINQLLADKEFDDAMNYIDSYSKRLRETFDIFYKILIEKSEEVRDLFLLERIGIFYPLLIKTYQLDDSQDKESFKKVAKLLELLSFRILSLKIKRTNDVDSAIHQLAKEFTGDYTSLFNSLKKKIIEFSPDNIFKLKLSSQNFYNDFSQNDQKYLFWKYENYLRTSGKAKYPNMSEKEFSEEGRKTGLSIEHIASQNPKVTIETAHFEEFTEEFKEKFLHALGNLTIDPQSANSSKGRKPIEEKNSKYFKKAPLMTQNELDDFIKNGKWASESIKDRQEKIILFALDYWNPNKVN
jgi:ribosomal protein S16